MDVPSLEMDDTSGEVSMTRILIADPDLTSRKALSLLLSTKLGITSIVEAGDTEMLIRCLADNSLDILLLDWKLYGAPAPETCRLILKAYPNLKIVLLSVDAEDHHYAAEAGAAFIHKGANPVEVLAVLESLVN
jgi:DNA-binding NarL/FixJ family response regulator